MIGSLVSIEWILMDDISSRHYNLKIDENVYISTLSLRKAPCCLILLDPALSAVVSSSTIEEVNKAVKCVLNEEAMEQINDNVLWK